MKKKKRDKEEKALRVPNFSRPEELQGHWSTNHPSISKGTVKTLSYLLDWQPEENICLLLSNINTIIEQRNLLMLKREMLTWKRDAKSWYPSVRLPVILKNTFICALKSQHLKKIIRQSWWRFGVKPLTALH